MPAQRRPELQLQRSQDRRADGGAPRSVTASLRAGSRRYRRGVCRGDRRRACHKSMRALDQTGLKTAGGRRRRGRERTARARLQRKRGARGKVFFPPLASVYRQRRDDCLSGISTAQTHPRIFSQRQAACVFGASALVACGSNELLAPRCYRDFALMVPAGPRRLALLRKVSLNLGYEVISLAL